MRREDVSVNLNGMLESVIVGSLTVSDIISVVVCGQKGRSWRERKVGARRGRWWREEERGEEERKKKGRERERERRGEERREKGGWKEGGRNEEGIQKI